MRPTTRPGLRVRDASLRIALPAESTTVRPSTARAAPSWLPWALPLPPSASDGEGGAAPPPAPAAPPRRAGEHVPRSGRSRLSALDQDVRRMASAESSPRVVANRVDGENDRDERDAGNRHDPPLVQVLGAYGNHSSPVGG